METGPDSLHSPQDAQADLQNHPRIEDFSSLRPSCFLAYIWARCSATIAINLEILQVFGKLEQVLYIFLGFRMIINLTLNFSFKNSP